MKIKPMKIVLCATDMSLRAELAVDRAAALARQFNARLRLLHVVDDDLPRAIVDIEIARARDVLDARLNDLDSADAPGAEIEIRSGSCSKRSYRLRRL